MAQNAGIQANGAAGMQRFDNEALRLQQVTNEDRAGNALPGFNSDLDESFCMKEEDYNPEDLEEMTERAMPFKKGMGNYTDQTIIVPNASASVHSSNLKQTDGSDEEDDIVSKLRPQSDSQFVFCLAGQALQKRLPQREV